MVQVSSREAALHGQTTQWQGAAAGGPAGTWDICMRTCWIGRADKGRAEGTQLGKGGTTLPAPGGQHLVALPTAGANNVKPGCSAG